MKIKTGDRLFMIDPFGEETSVIVDYLDQFVIVGVSGRGAFVRGPLSSFYRYSKAHRANEMWS
jgi:hypothetical protein